MGKWGGLVWTVLVIGGIAFVVNRLNLEFEEQVPGADGGPDAVLPGDAYATRPLQNSWPADAGAAGVIGADLGAVNYYLVMDGSGSMNSDECGDGRPKIDTAVAAVKTFVEAVPVQANLGLTVFDSQGTSERVPLGSGNRAQVIEHLDAIRAENATPLRSSIEIGYVALTRQAQAQLGYGEYHLVVVTDGYAEPAEEDPTELVNAILQQSPVVVHVIGFCIGEQHALNQPGRTRYTAANNTGELRAGLASVLAESPEFDIAAFPQP